MANGSRTPGLDRDGVRIRKTSGLPRDVIGLAVAGLGAAVAVLLLRSSDPPAPSSRPPVRAVEAPPGAPAGAPLPAAEPPTLATGVPSAAPSPTVPRTRTAKLRALRRAGIVPHVGPDGKPELDAAPVIELLNKAGVHEGIAVFPPPGTDPPRSGVIVPDGVELPEGFIRHYQSTDDGESLPPILLLHPDYDLFDEQGNPIAIPPDRVVPPELVPPGIPLKMLEVPVRGRSR